MIEEHLERLWLNPFLSDSDIAQRLKISRATFFRHVKKYDLKKVRVGVEDRHGFGLKTFLSARPHRLGPCDYFDLNVIKLLSQCLGIRFEIRLDSMANIFKNLSTCKIELAITSLTSQAYHYKNIYFSHPYSYKTPGKDVLSARSGPLVTSPKIGVMDHSLRSHKDFFREFDLPPQSRLKVYKNTQSLLEGLECGRVNKVLIHPLLAAHFLEKRSTHFRLENKFIPSKGATCIAMSENFLRHRETLNLLLEEFHNTQTLERLEDRCNQSVQDSRELCEKDKD